MTTELPTRIHAEPSDLTVAFDENQKAYVITPHQVIEQRVLKLPSNIGFGIQLRFEEGSENGRMNVTVLAILNPNRPDRSVVWKHEFIELKPLGPCDVREDETLPYASVRGEDRFLLFQAMQMAESEGFCLRIAEGMDNESPGLPETVIALELCSGCRQHNRYDTTLTLSREKTMALYRALGVRDEDIP